VFWSEKLSLKLCNFKLSNVFSAQFTVVWLVEDVSHGFPI